MKPNKKAFTIVELVIVIAIIAVLAAVLIPTFANVINKANVAKDTQLIRNLNTALATDRASNNSEPHHTLYDALQAAEAFGYDVGKINASATNAEILWDQENDVFCYLEGTKVVYLPELVNTGKRLATDIRPYHLWKIFDDKHPISENTYGFSIYWNGSELTNTVALNGIGFDAGTSSVSEISYTNSNAAIDVIIRTTGKNLNVGSSEAVAAGKIIHYGTLDTAIIYTTNTSFHTHGRIAKMELMAGKAVAEDKGYVALVKAAAGTEIEEVDTGIFYIASNATTADIDANVAATLGYTVTDQGTTADETRTAKINSTVYEIDNKFDLIAFRDAVNAGQDFSQITVVMTDDIDMSGYSWTSPIGDTANPFEGTFDGNGFKIKNLSNNGENSETFATNTSGYATSGNLLGLFGYVKGNSSFKNLDLEVYFYTSQKDSVMGGLYAKCEAAGSSIYVDDVDVYGRIQGTKYVAGLIGQHTKGKLTIKNCENHANVTSSRYAAGFLGGSAEVCANELTFNNCLNAGDITSTGSDPAAGIVANFNMAKQSVESPYSKTSEQKWADVINGPTFTYVACSNTGTISGFKNSTLFYDLGMSDDGIKNLTSLSLNNSYVKRTLLAYYNSEGRNVDWKDCDTYGILAGIAYDLNLEGDYAAFVGDCHATTIGKAATYQNSVDKSLVINVKKDFDTVDIHGSVNFENHSGNQINVKTNDTLTLSNGTLAKIKINNANAKVTLVNMVITGTALNQSEQADIYLQAHNVLSIVSGTYSFNPTSYLAEDSSAQDNGNGTWTVTANN